MTQEIQQIGEFWPEYAAAVAKLQRYKAAMADAEHHRRELADEAHMRHPVGRTPASALAAADAALSGEASDARGLSERADVNQELMSKLRRAIAAQEAAVSQARLTASAAMRRQVVGQHIELVRAIRAAVLALHDANVAELAFREQLEGAGFSAAGLGPGAFVGPQRDNALGAFNIFDTSGGYASSWWRDAERYIASGVLPADLQAPAPESASMAAKLAEGVKRAVRRHEPTHA